MTKLGEIKSGDVFGNRNKRFQKLMRFKVKEILLVSSMYDFYLFEEDGRLYEIIRNEYHELNLSHPPEITHVSSAAEAIDTLMLDNNIDLIITTLHIEDMHVHKFAQMVKKSGLTTPIVILAYDNNEKNELVTYYDITIFDKIFIWQGDYRILIGIIKFIEDRNNVENDTLLAGVQAIIVVEDNIKFYSSYIPIIYTEILNQSQRLISEGLNISQKFLRMRARPKILLCSTFEEAWNYYTKYKAHILGVISDISYPMNGEINHEAGIILSKKIREEMNDIPILLQSSNTDAQEKAASVGAFFLQKGSPTLLRDLRDYMINNFGFGDFIFKTKDGYQVGRATDLKSLLDLLKIIPDESLIYHAERNHFSNWLKARTEFWLAQRLRPVKVSDFTSPSDLRNQLCEALTLYLELRQLGTVTEFNPETFNPKNSFARIGNGSLGGKARGLAFINQTISNYNIRNKFKDVEISVPSSVVIATDVFDDFIYKNNLLDFALNCNNDVEILKKFVSTEYFPPEIEKQLSLFLEHNRQPLAIRSSSLLEDSQYMPFAGVYETYMIPNNNPDHDIRLHELVQTIRSIFASTFYNVPKEYIKATEYRLEEEKMAVIIQRMVGTNHNGRFYPDFAGVGRSHNFYPVPPQKSEDGIALVALGLGKTVVDGGNCIRFCPKYPRHLIQFFSTKETMKNAQQEFFALDMNGKIDINIDETHDKLVHKYSLEKSYEDGTLYYVGSTYSPENDRVYDGISREGSRVVTLAPILKHKIFPLPEILDLLHDLGSWGMGTPVEMEFAVNMSVPPKAPKEFAVLQMRPMVLSTESEDQLIEIREKNDFICYSKQTLGNGIIKNIYDVVVVDIDNFQRSKTRETALEVAKFNSKLIEQKRPYILIGVGRWGSMDHWLGIPVTWDQISGARVIVEADFKDIKVQPSQGSHFFQNLTSFKVGYFTINASSDNTGYIDWGWLMNTEPVEEMEYTRHLKFNEPITIKINSKQGIGTISKPGIIDILDR